jgi:hypothetical protein
MKPLILRLYQNPRLMLGIAMISFVAALVFLVVTVMWASAWWNRLESEAATPLADRVNTRAEFVDALCVTERTGSLILLIRYRYTAPGAEKLPDVTYAQTDHRNRTYKYSSKAECEVDKAGVTATRPSVAIWYSRSTPPRWGSSAGQPVDDRHLTILWATCCGALLLIGLLAIKQHSRLTPGNSNY